MKVSVSDARGQLTEWFGAEAGDEVILTRHGQPAVRLAPIKAAPDFHGRRKLIESIQLAAAKKRLAGAAAAQSIDFLYDEDGLPE